MARILPKYNWIKQSNLTRTEKATYPWDEWFDGRIWKLTWKKDFHPHPLMMERIVRTRATNRGAKVKLRHEALNGGSDDPFGYIVVMREDITYEPPAPVEKPKPTRKATVKTAPAKATATKRTPPVRGPRSLTDAHKAPANKKAPAKTRAPRSIKVDPDVKPTKRARKPVAAA